MKILKNKIAKINLYNLDKIIFLLSFLPLMIAYIAQYGFNLEPCNLCLYQRMPFFIILFLTLFSIFFLKNIKFKNYILYLSLLLLFSNMILALYHVGVEQKIFDLPSSCSGLDMLNISNIDQLTDIIMQKGAVKCDEPVFEIFGISMAAMNVFYCLFVIILIYPTRK
jgi:disulfide bond formation protein DsbB